MSQITFQRISGSVAPEDAPLSPLTNIRQLVEPPGGAHREFLETLGWPFEGDPNAAYRTATLSRTYFDLLDAGLLDALDLLIISNGWDVEGSLVNWVPGKPDMTNSEDPVTMVGGALTTDGLASHLSWPSPRDHYSKFALTDAEIFIDLASPPPAPTTSAPIIGSNGQATRFERLAASPYLRVALNASTLSAGSVTPATSPWRAGLWSITRSGADIGVLRDGDLIFDRVATDGNSTPSSLHVGRHGTGEFTTYGALGFTAFGLGKALTVNQRAALGRILKVHREEMSALAS